MADINKLKDKIKSTIYPNGKGAINASDHQAMLLDMADGMAETDTKLTELSEEINDISFAITDFSAYQRYDIEIFNGNWIAGNTQTILFPTRGGKKYRIVGTDITYWYMSLLKNADNMQSGKPANLCTLEPIENATLMSTGDRYEVLPSKILEFTAPQDCTFMLIMISRKGQDFFPMEIELIGDGIREEISEIKQALSNIGIDKTNARVTELSIESSSLICHTMQGDVDLTMFPSILAIDDGGIWRYIDHCRSIVFPCYADVMYKVKGNANNPSVISVVQNLPTADKEGVVYASNEARRVIYNANELEFVTPENAKYIVLQAQVGADDRTPQLLEVISLNKRVEELNEKLHHGNEPYNSIEMEDGCIYDTTGAIGTTFAFKKTQIPNYECALVTCVEGQQFIVNAEGSNYSAKPFTFLDANNVVLSNSGNEANVHSIITAPKGACYLVINNKNKNLSSHIIDGNIIIQNAANIIRLKKAIVDTNDILSFRKADSSYSSCRIVIDAVEDNNNRIVTANALYSGEPPTIQFFIDDIYVSTKYIIGGKDVKSTKQWRIPPAVKGKQIVVSIEVPSGATLYIDQFSCTIDNTKQSWCGGVRLDSHLGLQSLAPENTMIAFEMAAQCNSPACIVNPIQSKDGTWYCYHDYDATLTLDGVNYVALSDVEFRNMTDEEIAKYRVGGFHASHRKVYSEPIPLLEDFFCLCAKTGMRPMFSTHPTPTKEGWLQIKNMLVKYGLLNLMTVKAATLYILELAYSVLGDIEGYIYDVSGIEVDAYCDEFDNSALSAFKGRKAIEYIQSTMTENVAQRTIERGYIPSVWSVGNISGQRYYDLLSWGVMEFTDDNNASSGLNW